jgi:signal peptidase I
MIDSAAHSSSGEVRAGRRPLLAMTLSLMLPGLGQVYNGEVYKGAFLFALLALVPALSAWLAIAVVPAALSLVIVSGVLVALGVYVVSVVGAYRTAAALGERYILRPYNQPHAYLALFLAGYFFVLSPSVQHTREAWVELFTVPSASMTPTLWPGDRLFADKNVNRPGAAKLWRGAVTVFTYPNDRTLTYVKRIIGLPGDHVEIRGTEIVVNGRSTRGEAVGDLGGAGRNAVLAEHVAFREIGDRAPYVVLWKKDAPHADGVFDIPAGHVFVMGDNRDSTRDSRHFGVVALTDIVGVARQILVGGGSSRFDCKRAGENIR